MRIISLLLLMFPFLVFSQIQIGDDIDGESAEDRSGSSISLSSNGYIVAIGAWRNEVNGTDSGHVRIYENISETWTQIGDDIDAESVEDRFGWSVSLSSYGNVVAIGAPYNNGNGNRSGHVRIYENISGTWIQIGEDINGEEEYDESGSSVSLSSDGSIVAIGAQDNNGNGNHSGHVRIYKNISGVWTQIGEDINGEVEEDRSGASVSLSSDGSVVAIGAIGNDEYYSNSGHVRIYENISGDWTQVGSDIDGEEEYDESGFSVSLSSNGSIVAIGAPANNGNEGRENCGQVRVYENVSGIWTQIGSDIDGGSTNGLSGFSVSLSSDGSIVAIGAPYNNGNGIDSGHVRIYKNVSGVWTQVGTDIDGEFAYDESGTSVSLSSNGSVVAIGAPYNNGNGNQSGHVRVFDLTDALSIKENTITLFSLYPNPAQNQVTIQLQEGIELKQVNIYNALGQFISTTKEKIINTSHLSTGLYLLEIETNQGKATKQLVIE